MPFTLSHAAAALPFRRFKPIWPALVIGTFAPDLQYFVLLSDEDRSGHHFPDVLLFTIPLALLVLWLFEHVVKGPAVELLPSALQLRLQDKLEPLSFAGWRRFASIVLWISVGVSTHLAWDQFTHSYSRTARHWTLLQTMHDLPLLHFISVAHLLQHISTVVGLAALAVWFAVWFLQTAPAQQPQVREFSPWLKAMVVATMATIALMAGYPVAMFRLAYSPRPKSPVALVAMTFVASTAFLCIQLLLYGMVMTLSTRARRRPAAQAD